MSQRRFARAAAFDWSGEAVARPRGIALALCERDGEGIGTVRLIQPDGGWSRCAALDWLGERAAAGDDLLIGMDVSAGLPFADAGAFFPGWPDSPPDAHALWESIDVLSAADPHFGVAGFLAHAEARAHFRHRGELGVHYGAARAGRLRVVEQATRTQGIANPYSSLNLVGAAQVGKASLTAMRLFHRLRGVVPVWPMAPVPATGPLIVEIYSSIAALAAGRAKGRAKMREPAAVAAALDRLGARLAIPLAAVTDHEADAIVTAAWLHRAQYEAALWSPAQLTPSLAQTEGWTFGVG